MALRQAITHEQAERGQTETTSPLHRSEILIRGPSAERDGNAGWNYLRKDLQGELQRELQRARAALLVERTHRRQTLIEHFGSQAKSRITDTGSMHGGALGRILCCLRFSIL